MSNPGNASGAAAAGPGLTAATGDVARMNAWGDAVADELRAMRETVVTMQGQLAGTQAVLGATIDEAKVALTTMGATSERRWKRWSPAPRQSSS